MPVKIRPRGIGLIVVAILLFALAGFTRIGWLLLFDAVLWGTITVSAVMPWLAIGDLQIRRRVTGWQSGGEFPGPLEGDAVNLDVSLTNRGLLPCVFANVVYHYDEQVVQTDRQRMFVAWLGRNQKYTRTTKVTFVRRGLHRLPPLEVETSVPFGMFRRSKTAIDPVEVIVLPRVYPLGRMHLRDSSGNASQYSLRARVGEQTTGSRGYVTGDPWHHIHWRNTARTSQPQVKEFEKTPDSALAIAFDISPYESGSDALEHAVKIAASVGDYVCRSGGMVRLMTGQASVETADRYYLLKSLALLRGPEKARFPGLAEAVPPFSAMLAVLKDTDAAGIREVALLASARRLVTAVVLRGFDPGNTPSNPTEDLRQAGANVLECWPGDAARVVAELDDSPAPGDKGKLRVGAN